MSKTVKVILLKDSPNIGQRNEVKSVRFGFAKNWLIPQKLAMLATRPMIAHLEKEKVVKEKEDQSQQMLYRELSEKLTAITLTFRPKKTPKGTLYAAIDGKKIAESLKRKKIDLDPKYIIVKEPIKRVGEYDIPVLISEALKATLKVLVQ